MSNRRTEICHQAIALINGDRQREYGTPVQNFTRIADRWSQHLDRTIWPAEVCLMMSELKLARLANGYHEDSVRDAIGYLALYAELQEAGHGQQEAQSDAGAHSETDFRPVQTEYVLERDLVTESSLGEEE